MDEKLVGDLIRHVAKTHVITSRNQEDAARFKVQLAQLEHRVERMQKDQQILRERVKMLENAQKVYS